VTLSALVSRLRMRPADTGPILPVLRLLRLFCFLKRQGWLGCVALLVRPAELRTAEGSFTDIKTMQ
jgi:hypothetical protein